MCAAEKEECAATNAVRMHSSSSSLPLPSLDEASESSDSGSSGRQRTGANSGKKAYLTVSSARPPGGGGIRSAALEERPASRRLQRQWQSERRAARGSRRRPTPLPTAASTTGASTTATGSTAANALHSTRPITPVLKKTSSFVSKTGEPIQAPRRSGGGKKRLSFSDERGRKLVEVKEEPPVQSSVCCVS